MRAGLEVRSARQGLGVELYRPGASGRSANVTLQRAGETLDLSRSNLWRGQVVIRRRPARRPVLALGAPSATSPPSPSHPGGTRRSRRRGGATSSAAISARLAAAGRRVPQVGAQRAWLVLRRAVAPARGRLLGRQHRGLPPLPPAAAAARACRATSTGRAWAWRSRSAAGTTPPGARGAGRCGSAATSAPSIWAAMRCRGSSSEAAVDGGGVSPRHGDRRGRLRI